MASMVFDSYWYDQVIGAIGDIRAASGIKVALATSAFAPNKKTTVNYSALGANEVATGNGYTAGGTAVTPTATNTTANDTTVMSFPGATWTTAGGQTLTARWAVYYKVTGGNVVFAVDFATDQIASGGGTLTLGASTITINNA